MTAPEFLLCVRGPLLNIAIAIFIVGVIMRLAEIFLLGQRPDYSVPKGNAMQGGVMTMVTRSKIDMTKLQRAFFTILLGYTFHIGLLVTVFLFTPHILFFREFLGFGWPALPTPIIDWLTLITLFILVATLLHRLESHALRHISTPQDYLAWGITFLPMLTGYMAFHHIIFPYPVLLGLHILSVELLLVVFPFSKLMHAFTIMIARWYNGANAAHKGVQA